MILWVSSGVLSGKVRTAGRRYNKVRFTLSVLLVCDKTSGHRRQDIGNRHLILFVAVGDILVEKL